MLLRKLYALLITLICMPAALFAQKPATIKGFIKNDRDGQPIFYANVKLEGTRFGISTDASGFYSLNQLPPGTYTLKVTYLGYETISESVTLKEGESLVKNYTMKPEAKGLTGATITAETVNKKEDTRVSTINVTPDDIKRLPSIADPDFAQFLQVVPGVNMTGDQGGQLYIRGGTPVQNKLLLDGMIIYNPFHSIGLFSVLETEAIRSAEVYTGGFNANYGGRISSIMDITTKDGNLKRHSGQVSANTFSSKLILEGPFKKMSDKSNVSASYMIAGKYSYLPQSSKLLYQYSERGKDGLPFGYGDIYGKISLNAGKGNKVSFFGFTYTDRANFQGISDVKWNQYGGGLNFTLVPNTSNLKIDGNFGYSSYKIQLLEGNNTPRSSSINGFNFGLNFNSFFRRDRLIYGLEVVGFNTNFSFYNAANRAISQEENTTEFAAFMRYKMNRGKWVFDPGFRVHYYASLNNLSAEPRLAVKFNATEKFRIKMSGGMYSQNLIAANSDRDVVNFFYGFLSGSDNLPKTFDGKQVRTKLQKAQHAILGFEYDITRNLSLNLEGYYKNFQQLSNLNRDKIYEDNALNADKPDRLKKDFIIERGYAAGLDFLLNYKTDRLYIWTVYSLTYTKRYDEIDTYFPVFDRRHNINLVASYRLGKKKNWEVGARWNLGSGFPFTQTSGTYELLDFQSGGIQTDYVFANGSIGTIYDDLNAGRLPWYHRLDISAKYTVLISDYMNFEVNMAVTNVYNRKNVFYIDRLTSERVNQLPVLPTVGVKFAW